MSNFQIKLDTKQITNTPVEHKSRLDDKSITTIPVEHSPRKIGLGYKNSPLTKTEDHIQSMEEHSQRSDIILNSQLKTTPNEPKLILTNRDMPPKELKLIQTNRKNDSLDLRRTKTK